MRICVQGLWHLGTVTAACLARAGFATVGLDSDPANIARLSNGQAPLFEPGLDDLIQAGMAAGRLSFTTDLSEVAQADLIWVAFDTPVDEDDRSDAGFVVTEVERLFPLLNDGAVVLITAQLPVGTTSVLERAFARVAEGRRVGFAYSPENLRLGKAIQSFEHPERIIVGTRDRHARAVLEPVLARFSSQIIWLSVESAELAKHALNAFLATTVTFMNEIATICEQVGGDAAEVERALRSEPRIGPNAYIRPGAGFAGGTLARDVMTLNQIAEERGLSLPLLGGIMPSNKHHLHWPARQLAARLGDLVGRHVCILGLTYKPGTDSLRRSSAIDLCRSLLAAGAVVTVHDPHAEALPAELAAVTRHETPIAALAGAEAAVLMTEWPLYRDLTADEIAATMAQPLVLDQNRFLANRLAGQPGVRYLTVGTP
jgi:UDPglucose 6-dehydrogenase